MIEQEYSTTSHRIGYIRYDFDNGLFLKIVGIVDSIVFRDYRSVGEGINDAFRLFGRRLGTETGYNGHFGMNKSKDTYLPSRNEIDSYKKADILDENDKILT